MPNEPKFNIVSRINELMPNPENKGNAVDLFFLYTRSNIPQV